MQQLPLVARFYAFIASQLPERKINHSDWRTCAVGEFYESEGVKVWESSYDKHISELREDLPENVDRALTRKLYRSHTYGDLQKQVAGS